MPYDDALSDQNSFMYAARPSDTVMLYSKKKSSSSVDVLSILKYGPSGVPIGGHEETPNAGPGDLCTKMSASKF